MNNINSLEKGVVHLERINVAGNLKDIREFIAVDIETTGLNPNKDKILEIGAVYFKEGKVIDTFNMLINPEIRIPRKISMINNITNSMVKNKPVEKEVIKSFLEFINVPLEEGVPFCAHNAIFDFNFLKVALKNINMDIRLSYFDTLHLSRKFLNKLPNHKQSTLENYFNILNETPHKALSDAKSCGEIFLKISEIYGNTNKKRKRKVIKEKNIPTHEELQVCAYIQNTLKENGVNNQIISFYRNNSKYVDVRVNGINFLRFKVSRKRKYIICRKEYIDLEGLVYEDCIGSEGGIKYARVFFSKLSMLKKIENYLIIEYYLGIDTWEKYIENGKDNELELYVKNSIILDEKEINNLLKYEEKWNDNFYINIRKKVSMEELIISKVPNRIPLSKIKYSKSKGFNMGFPIYKEGEAERKAGNIEKSIALFDLSREKGYCAPALYISYALAYRKIKDYENEILILQEGMERNNVVREKCEARLNRAMELLYKKQRSSK